MRALTASIASGIGYGLLFPPFSLGTLSWVVLIPLFVALRSGGAKRAAWNAAVWGCVATALIVAWLLPTLQGHYERSPAFAALFLGFVSLTAMAPYAALAFSAWAFARAHVPRWSAPLLLAAAWVTMEYARTNFGIASPWGKLGDVHANSERLRQLASVTGVYGVGAVVALVNAAGAELCCLAWARFRQPCVNASPAAAAVAAAVLALGISHAYGAHRLRAPQDDGAPLDVLLVQGNLPPAFRWKRTKAARVLTRYVGLTRTAVAQGGAPELVIWPENALQTSLDDPVFGPPVRALTRSGMPLLLGAPRDADERRYNSALLLRPNGERWHYDKRRLLAFGEKRSLGWLGDLGPRGDLDAAVYTAGGEIGTLPLEDGTLGVLICMEALYPAMARETARAGANWIAVLSNDGWYQGRGGAEQHLAQVSFRAVETGRSLVRATTTGISAVVDARGTRLGEIPEGESGVLRIRVPSSRETTWYLRLGDAFAQACAAGLNLALLASLRARRSTPRAAQPIMEPAK